MRHAPIPSREQWADGPQAAIRHDAANFRTETVNQWLELCAHAKDKVPEKSQILAGSNEPFPYNPIFLAAERLKTHGYGIGIARSVGTSQGPHHPAREGLATYLAQKHEAIRPYIQSDLKDPVRRPHTATLNRVYAGRIILDTFNIGSRPHTRARVNYASLGDNNIERAIQRTFMTTALTEDYARGLQSSNAPLTAEASLFMQRARGLYGILHAEGIRPYGYDELGTIALCSLDLDGLNDIGLKPPLKRPILEASL
jgi:hypothetical protein